MGHMGTAGPPMIQAIQGTYAFLYVTPRHMNPNTGKCTALLQTLSARCIMYHDDPVGRTGLSHRVYK